MKHSAPATVAIFAMVGPAVASVTAAIWIGWNEIAAMPELALLLVMWSLPAGYLLGFAPALITGLIAVWLSRRIANGWIWAGAMTFIGATLSAVAGPLFDFGSGALSLVQQARLFAGCGAAATLVCSLICVKFRPRAA